MKMTIKVYVPGYDQKKIQLVRTPKSEIKLFIENSCSSINEQFPRLHIHTSCINMFCSSNLFRYSYTCAEVKLYHDAALEAWSAMNGRIHCVLNTMLIQNQTNGFIYHLIGGAAYRFGNHNKTVFILKYCNSMDSF